MTLLTDPGPSKDQLRRMLTIAARVPDHGALQPWRFIVIDGEARRHASERLAPIFAAENEAMEPAQREKFTGVISRVLTHAPLIVIVVSRTSGGAHPSLGAGSFSRRGLHEPSARGACAWLCRDLVDRVGSL